MKVLDYVISTLRHTGTRQEVLARASRVVVRVQEATFRVCNRN